jgi:Ca2+/H+ antiporter, TMEM165/GDT1 family
MPALFLAMLTCALAVIGSRPALLVARLSEGRGGTVLVLICWLTAAVTSALAGWAATPVIPLMAPPAKGMVVAAAVLLAAFELLFMNANAPAAEPTRSFGAIALVLVAGQVTDSARFFVLALAVATAAPALAAIGGAIGSGAVLTVALALGADWESRMPLRAIRRVVSAVFLLAAIVVGLSARGVIG